MERNPALTPNDLVLQKALKTLQEMKILVQLPMNITGTNSKIVELMENIDEVKRLNGGNFRFRSDKMRDPARIKEITDTLRGIWHQVPDLRLGQLLVNCTSDLGTDLFYVEDDKILQCLKDYAKNLKEKYPNDGEQERIENGGREETRT